MEGEEEIVCVCCGQGKYFLKSVSFVVTTFTNSPHIYVYGADDHCLPFTLLLVGVGQRSWVQQSCLHAIIWYVWYFTSTATRCYQIG